MRGAGRWPVVAWNMWLGAVARAPPVRVSPAPSGRGRAFLPAKLDASPGRFRFVRAFGDRTPPSPTRRLSDAAGTCQAGVCGDAASMARQPARTGMRIKRRRLKAPQRVHLSKGRCGRCTACNRFRPFARKDPCPDPPRSGRSPRWPGCRFASFRPAGTAPANRNSPPSAGQGSVSPGHPFRTEGEASVAWGERVGKMVGGFFWRCLAEQWAESGSSR